MNEKREKAAISKTIGKEELFELILDSATDYAIFTTDPRGLVTSWNSGAERLFGFSEEEIVGQSGDLIFTPEDRVAGAPEEERLRAFAEGRAMDERWHMRQNGSRFWASGMMMALKDPSRGFVKITRDRTEQHEAERRLRESEERFRLLATNIPQLVFRALDDGQRHWSSPQWGEFTGLGLDESQGFGWLDAVHPDDRDPALQAWQEARATGEYYHEHRIRRADGEYRWHQTRARPIETPDGSNSEWVGTTTDIHALKRMQGRQQVLLAELQHRTRNLLAVVMSVANQTIRTSPSLDYFRAEFESRLLALSRVQGLLAQGDQNRADILELVSAELAAHVHDTDQPDKVRIDGPAAPLSASAAQTMGLAVHELATNAVKYGALAQPGAKLTVTWTIEEAHNRPWVRLEWRETGVRMPESGTPLRRGYGRELIERALRYQLDADTRLVFGPDGVSCIIVLPVDTWAGAEV
ncbi:sensor histidine kinase [Rhodoligotrophos defluvii]|uniref:sensor histidine kinase n=1 Tax=Rhodoligotrophos defluvii TaxID=2561934 RepID=UPI0010C9ECC0|nr:PAS domain S-box protein [Rhodoligotrophos defluvii]